MQKLFKERKKERMKKEEKEGRQIEYNLKS